jgi:hypothetical protein
VAYDIEEEEIHTIAIGEGGNVYFGTASGTRLTPPGPPAVPRQPQPNGDGDDGPAMDAEKPQEEESVHEPADDGLPQVKSLAGPVPEERSESLPTAEPAGTNAVYRLDPGGNPAKLFQRDAMSFLALEVIPSLKITDQGLVDVEAFRPVDLWVD